VNNTSTGGDQVVVSPANAETALASEGTAAEHADFQLIEGLRHGDEQAYVDLVQTQAGGLLKTARRYLGEKDAPDAVQEAFLRAFQSIDRFKGASSLNTWLHRILINCCLMKLRKSKTVVEVSIDTLLPSFLEDGHRANTKPAWPEECAEQRELVMVVSSYIQKLPDSYRTVLMLRDIDGFTGDETAKMLDISPNLVKVRLHRARLALRELIDPAMRSVL